jgi:hypothetical protein
MTSVDGCPPWRSRLIEIGDLRQLPQGLRRFELHFAHDRTQACVGLLAATMLAEVAAHHVVERERLGQSDDVHRQSCGQFFGEPFVQRTQAGVGLHAQQVGTDDRDHPAFLDVIQQVVPGVVIETL